jgi:hypothetical protein
MAKHFTCKEVEIEHSKMIELRKAGLLNLGIDNLLAALIAGARGQRPESNHGIGSVPFWSWVAIGVFMYSIYLSITQAWWWFIPGIVMMQAIWKANKKGNSENLLDAAMIDQELYERVRPMGGWLYELGTANRRK